MRPLYHKKAARGVCCALVAALMLAAAGCGAKEPFSAGKPAGASASPSLADISASLPPEGAAPSAFPGGGREYALRFDADNAPFGQAREIRPLDTAGIGEVFTEQTVGSCRVFIWKADPSGAYVGIETGAGMFLLLFNDADYAGGYAASDFSRILGANGVKVTVPEGTAAVITYYYTVENGVPALLVCANNAAEADLDGDGDSELIHRMLTNPSTCYIAKSIGGAVMWSDDLHALMSANGGVEYDPERNVFTAQWYEPGEGGDVKERAFAEYRYENGRLVLRG